MIVMHAHPPVPVEGWYADESVPGEYRYWDGAGWTEKDVPRGTPVSPVAATSGDALRKGRRVLPEGVTVALLILAFPMLAALFALAPSPVTVSLVLVGGFVALALVGLIVRRINAGHRG